MKEVSFGSSLSDIDTAVSDTEYRDRLVTMLKKLLEFSFPKNPAKQALRMHRDRITFSCPLCGDSMVSDHKKRGNVILTGKFANHYKCFNCGSFQRIDRFFRSFKIDLDLGIVNYIAKGIEDFSSRTNVKYDMSIFLDVGVIDQHAIGRQEFLKRFDLVEARESPASPWLRARLQFDDAKFMYSYKENSVVILNLTQSGKVLGAQKRLFKKDNNYLTYKLSRLYGDVGLDPGSVPEEIDAVSQLFNACLVDYSRPLTLFEGPFDSFLFKNSIANCGANKGFPYDFRVRYFYDDDPTGNGQSMEKLNEGEPVFLWTKFRQDFGLPHRKKWDLNDALLYFKEKNLDVPDFERYFSDNPLDMIDI